MSRSYSIDASIKLPRVTGSRCMTLAQQMLTAAAEQEASLKAAGASLPPLISRPRDRLIGVAAALEVVLGPITAADSMAAVNADNEVDKAWGLFRDWISSQTRLPATLNPNLEKVAQLERSLFSDGLSFLSMTFREEWAQSELRLRYIADNGYTSMIDALGGTPFLSNLQAVHARYGKVLGVTTSVQEETSPEIRDNLLKTISAIKEYVFKVMAWADVEETGSETLRDALLLPLTEWVDTAPSSGDTAEASSDAAAGSE